MCICPLRGARPPVWEPVLYSDYIYIYIVHKIFFFFFIIGGNVRPLPNSPTVESLLRRIRDNVNIVRSAVVGYMLCGTTDLTGQRYRTCLPRYVLLCRLTYSDFRFRVARRVVSSVSMTFVFAASLTRSR